MADENADVVSETGESESPTTTTQLTDTTLGAMKDRVQAASQASEGVFESDDEDGPGSPSSLSAAALPAAVLKQKRPSKRSLKRKHSKEVKDFQRTQALERQKFLESQALERRVNDYDHFVKRSVEGEVKRASKRGSKRGSKHGGRGAPVTLPPQVRTDKPSISFTMASCDDDAVTSTPAPTAEAPPSPENTREARSSPDDEVTLATQADERAPLAEGLAPSPHSSTGRLNSAGNSAGNTEDSGYYIEDDEGGVNEWKPPTTFNRDSFLSQTGTKTNPHKFGVLVHKGRSVAVRITGSAVEWTKQLRFRGASDIVSLALEKIVGVTRTMLTPKQWPTFTVYAYQESATQHVWGLESHTFQVRDNTDCAAWVEGVKRGLFRLARPRRLRVFVNPHSGKKRGVRIYERQVAPLFEIAGVDAIVTTTTHAHHAWDTLAEADDLDSYDGVVCVGGDGTLVECLNGMMSNPHLSKPLPIGLIPGGSTDTIVFTSSGTNDPQTAAMQIICGKRVDIDLLKVDQPNMPSRYAMAFTGYGFFGDAVRDSEHYRWMGPARYMWSGAKTFLMLRSYKGKVRYLTPKAQAAPLSGDHHSSKCYSPCAECDRVLDESDEGFEWKETTGKFVAVNMANIACASEKTPLGFAPGAHLSDGLATMVLVKKCSRWRYIKFLLRVSGRKDQFRFNNVEAVQVRKMEFTPTTGRTSVWNVDGEIFEPPEMKVSVLRRHFPLMIAHRTGSD